MWLYKMEKYGVIKNESLKVKVKIIEADFFVWVVYIGVYVSKCSIATIKHVYCLIYDRMRIEFSVHTNFLYCWIFSCHWPSDHVWINFQ